MLRDAGAMACLIRMSCSNRYMLKLSQIVLAQASRIKINKLAIHLLPLHG